MEKKKFCNTEKEKSGHWKKWDRWKKKLDQWGKKIGPVEKNWTSEKKNWTSEKKKNDQWKKKDSSENKNFFATPPGAKIFVASLVKKSLFFYGKNVTLKALSVVNNFRSGSRNKK